MSQQMLAEHFEKYFEVVFANTEELKQEAYKIRYNVYCEELGWEQQRSSQIEIDAYDKFSYFCLLRHKRTGMYAGTIRMIIPPTSSPRTKLPLEEHCLDSLEFPELNPENCNIGSYSEVSRLCVRSEFRRRPNEQKKPFYIADWPHGVDPFSEEERRSFPSIAMGLYLGAVAVANMCKHEHIFVMAEVKLIRRLRRLGLPAQQIGKETDYHGMRALFYLPRADFTSGFAKEVKALYDTVEEMVLNNLKLIPYV